ncbi:hypothetical protein ACE10Z_23455 [Bradyrhizobium sp. Pha-3]|uniref:hypothetical protein n=1 Tax=Bradyrhizobium sp. Pha-3 TaxID=208375 RepID=UPI0035D49F39
MTEAGNFEIPPVSMGQSISIVADVVAGFIGSMRPQNFTGTDHEMKVYHQTAVSLFLYQLLMRSKHKEEMAKILEAIIVELRSPEAA